MVVVSLLNYQVPTGPKCANQGPHFSTTHYRRNVPHFPILSWRQSVLQRNFALVALIASSGFSPNLWSSNCPPPSTRECIFAFNKQTSSLISHTLESTTGSPDYTHLSRHEFFVSCPIDSTLGTPTKLLCLFLSEGWIGLSGRSPSGRNVYDGFVINDVRHLSGTPNSSTFLIFSDGSSIARNR